jgi:DNA invertase Pin-like site-specific DNA recombinase
MFSQRGEPMKTKDVIDYFGSKKAVADALGIWPQAVYRWGEDVPDAQAYRIQQIVRQDDATLSAVLDDK